METTDDGNDFLVYFFDDASYRHRREVMAAIARDSNVAEPAAVQYARQDGFCVVPFFNPEIKVVGLNPWDLVAQVRFQIKKADLGGNRRYVQQVRFETANGLARYRGYMNKMFLRSMTGTSFSIDQTSTECLKRR